MNNNFLIIFIIYFFTVYGCNKTKSLNSDLDLNNNYNKINGEDDHQNNITSPEGRISVEKLDILDASIKSILRLEQGKTPKLNKKLHIAKGGDLNLGPEYAIKWGDFFDKGILYKSGVSIKYLLNDSYVSKMKKQFFKKKKKYSDVVFDLKNEFSYDKHVKRDLSEKEGLNLFKSYIDSDIIWLKNNIKVPLFQYEFDSLVSTLYNSGRGRLAGKKGQNKYPEEKVNIIKSINNREYQKAAAELSLIKTFWGSKFWLGLQKRRYCEVFQFLNKIPDFDKDLSAQIKIENDDKNLIAKINIFWNRFKNATENKQYLRKEIKDLTSNYFKILNANQFE